MGLGWLASSVRRGPQALSHVQIDPQEMLSWDWQTIVETCRDDLTGIPDDQADYINEEVEKAWLRRLERVETSVFNGTTIDTSPRKGASSNKDDDILDRASHRIGKTRTVIIDGFHVAKETLDCRMGEAVPTMAGKDPRLAEWKPQKRPEIIHQEVCFFCRRRRSLQECKSCPRVFHLHCLDRALVTRPEHCKPFTCSHHRCWNCERTAHEAGGLLYACQDCEDAFCERCLDWNHTMFIGDTIPEYEGLGYSSPKTYYIRCENCSVKRKADSEIRGSVSTKRRR